MVSSSFRRLYRVLDLPGFRQFEDMVVYHGRTMLEDWRCDELSKQTFGLTYLETIILESQNHVESETEGMDAYLVLPILDRLGLDFRNDYGQPLKITTSFCRQAEYAIKFNHWTPSIALGREDVMAERLSNEVENWLAKKEA